MSALTRAYARYNRLYFSNSLPTDTPVHYSKRLPTSLYGCINEPDYGPGILINHDIKCFYEITMLTLLHEMAHIVTDAETVEHGPCWQREMRRLARAGAFNDLW